MTISDHDHDHRTDPAETRPAGRFVRTDTPRRGTTGGRHFPRNGLGEATDPVLHEAPDRDAAPETAPETAPDGAPVTAAKAAPDGAPRTGAKAAPDGAPRTAATAAAAAPTPATPTTSTSTVLLPPDLAAQSARRLDRAMAGFVDDPGRAVREADEALDETVRQLVENLDGRRTALREAWQGSTGGAGSKGGAEGGSSRTEDLRLALRDYRDLLQHLLAV
ncbi:hypothetical protein ACFV6F_08195 [Kitasatospora phosalacinea]|uniref:hypothetical protein n=1 Tax=Kitasatospora phosalacinea TaxID=2065 RepID=UPI00365CC865